MVVRDSNWWKSDAAYEHRCAQYLTHMLWADEHKKRIAFGGPEPDWPAVFHYHADMDEPYWLECTVPTHLRDYAQNGNSDHMNAAARAIIAR